MKNYVQRGNVLTVIAPAGGIASGEGLLVGSIFGVAAYTAAEGAEAEISVVGVYTLPKAAVTIAVGAPVYWDATAKKITTTAASNTLVGVATKAAATGVSIASVRLNGAFGLQAA